MRQPEDLLAWWELELRHSGEANERRAGQNRLTEMANKFRDEANEYRGEANRLSDENNKLQGEMPELQLRIHQLQAIAQIVSI